MAIKTDYTLAEIRAVQEGYNHYYESGIQLNDAWSDFNKKFKWKSRDDFFTTLSELTGIQDPKEIKKASETLSRMEEDALRKNTVTSNSLNAGQIETLTEAEQRAAEKSKEAKEIGIKKAQDFINRKQEAERIKQLFKTGPIYTKEEGSPPPVLDDKEKENINKLKEIAITNPEELAKELEKEIGTELSSLNQSKFTKEDVKQTAETIVKGLSGDKEAHNAFVLTALSVNQGVLTKSLKDPKKAGQVENFVKNNSIPQVRIYKLSREISLMVFGNSFTDTVIPENIISEVSNTQSVGFQTSTIPEVLTFQAKNLDEGKEVSSETTEIRKEVLNIPKRSQISKVNVPLDIKKGDLDNQTDTEKALKVGTKEVSKAVAESNQKLASSLGITIQKQIKSRISNLGSKIKIFFKRQNNSPQIATIGGGALLTASGLASGSGLTVVFGAGVIIAGYAINPSIVTNGVLFSPVAAIAKFFSILINSTMEQVFYVVSIALLSIPLIFSLVFLIINSGAYVVPQPQTTVSVGSSIISPYIDVVKTPNPAGPFSNSNLPLTVEYSITISAKQGNLTNVKIEYDCNVTKRSGSASCPSIDPEISDPPETISPGSPHTFSYKQSYNSAGFQDSLIVDTITVTADASEQKGAKAAGSASIKIGNPPDNCPSSTMWPLDGVHTITQTPGGAFSHKTVEALDLSAGMGTPVKATHSGKATVVRTSNAYRPLYVDIASNCGGKDFVSRYAHLSTSSVTTGQQVTMGQTIGTSGSAGTGPHLHYEFRGLRMDLPYVPKSIIRNCSDDGGKCGSIP